MIICDYVGNPCIYEANLYGPYEDSTYNNRLTKTQLVKNMDKIKLFTILLISTCYSNQKPDAPLPLLHNKKCIFICTHKTIENINESYMFVNPTLQTFTNCIRKIQQYYVDPYLNIHLIDVIMTDTEATFKFKTFSY